MAYIFQLDEYFVIKKMYLPVGITLNWISWIFFAHCWKLLKYLYQQGSFRVGTKCNMEVIREEISRFNEKNVITVLEGYL